MTQVEGPAEDIVGRGVEGGGEGEEIRNHLANSGYSQVVLDFLSTTDVGRLVSAEGDARSEVSAWEHRDWEVVESGGRGLGAGDELPLFLLTPSFTASADE